MKKLILTITLVLSLSISAQNKKYTFYSATGISVTNSDNFKETSYLSTELGVTKDNISIGVILGRNNLVDNGVETIKNYWYEVKSAVSFPIETVSAYSLIGVGSYFGSEHIFIEYGGGVSKSFKKYSIFAQVTNWDNVNYITLGVQFNLN